jgi:hypothetical protein
MTFDQWLSLGIWLSAATSVALLAVGLQVPVRLGWRDDLAKLTLANRRLMWGYATFVALTFVGFGVVTALLHGQMLAGDHEAGVVATLMAIWWTARIAHDGISLRHAPWPSGAQYVAAHALLLVGFMGMAAVYWTVSIRALAR